MSQLRLNPLNGRWVTIAAERASRPADFAPRRLPVETGPERPCPFCPGNEEATPPALETYGRDGSWLVRVVPNLYPAFSGSGPLAITELGPGVRAGARQRHPRGAGHRPRPRPGLGRASTTSRPGLVMAAVRDRLEDHGRQAAVRYTQTIVNHGREAGASLDHPHGQLLGIPFVPGELLDELDGFERFAAEHGPNATITTITTILGRACCARWWRSSGTRAIGWCSTPDRVLVVCPFWSGSPYELLVLPTRHEGHLAGAAPADLVAVGRALRDALARLRGPGRRRGLQPGVPHRAPPRRRPRSTGTCTCSPG